MSILYSIELSDEEEIKEKQMPKSICSPFFFQLISVFVIAQLKLEVKLQNMRSSDRHETTNSCSKPSLLKHAYTFDDSAWQNIESERTQNNNYNATS